MQAQTRTVGVVSPLPERLLDTRAAAGPPPSSQLPARERERTLAYVETVRSSWLHLQTLFGKIHAA